MFFVCHFINWIRRFSGNRSLSTFIWQAQQTGARQCTRSLAVAPHMLRHAQDPIVMEYDCRFIALHARNPVARRRGVSSAHDRTITRCQSGIRSLPQYVVLIMYFQTTPTQRTAA
jgi:hypothetical protein